MLKSSNKLSLHIGSDVGLKNFSFSQLITEVKSAIQSVVNDIKTDIHYSTVSTLSRADAEKLRAEMVSLIEKYVATVAPSKEETMVGFNLDFYSLIKK